MVALRRAGRFNRPQVPRNSAPRIPELITQFWNDPEPPPDVRRLMDSWASSNPGFGIEVFDDVRAFAYLRERLNPIVAGAFNRTIEPAQRADLFRLARLFLDGGYYIDADDLARGSLNANVPYDAEFFAYQEDLGSIGNNILGVVPGHPVIGLALQEAVAAVTRGDRDIVWLSTGPGLLTRSFASWLVADHSAMGQRIASVTILTVDEMRRVAAMFCHAAYKATNRAWLNNAFPKRKRL